MSRYSRLITDPSIEPRSLFLPLATGLTYHALEWDEAAADHTVVLIHGFLDLGRGWAPLARAGLATRYHLVAPDMRGHGDSDRVGAGGYYHFLDYLADLHELIAQVGRDRVSLVGHSMGGSIASYYAGTYPERVATLALLEGLGPPETPTAMPDRVKAWLASWRRARERAQPTYETREAAARRLQKHDPLLSDELALELAEHGTRLEADGKRAFKHDLAHLTMGPYPFRFEAAQSFWERVACPVLLIDGAESALRHSDEEQARRQNSFRDARRVVLDSAAHMIQRHRPTALAELLADFLG